ncbi:MAG: hypothetical protein BGO12_04675 [Verrucomicrobia bacterium 61-8]|nr:hypothetical protein [Verrucomicrobiota bacterium]OJU99064.1 MAG: hypothetical protein BGO12_04675 [Verrucomicrobia bacterium 61-8]
MSKHIDHPLLIGISDVRKNDPFALTEHIRYLVKHHHDFARYRDQLRTILAGHRGETGSVWRIYEEFLSLLELYESSLDTGSYEIEILRQRVEKFDLHLNGEEPSPVLPQKPDPAEMEARRFP